MLEPYFRRRHFHPAYLIGFQMRLPAVSGFECQCWKPEKTAMSPLVLKHMFNLFWPNLGFYALQWLIMFLFTLGSLVPNFTLRPVSGFCAVPPERHCCTLPDDMVSFEMNDLKSMHLTSFFL